MDMDKKATEELVAEYRADIAKLAKYIPWLETKSGKDVASTFSGEGIAEHSVSIPVYDGTLMAFIKEAKKTGLMNRNYVYTYSRNHLQTVQDEQYFIEKATIRNMRELGDILSRYVLLGMTKSVMWREGVENRIFLDVITKMKDLIEFWDKPLA